MWNAAKGILRSKKFLAALVSGVVWGVGLFGLELSQAEVLGAVMPLWLYIIGQAWADGGQGKEKVKAETEARLGTLGEGRPDTE